MAIYRRCVRGAAIAVCAINYVAEQDDPQKAARK